MYNNKCILYSPKMKNARGEISFEILNWLSKLGYSLLSFLYRYKKKKKKII